MTFGELLKRFREKSGLLQVDLAKTIGVTQTYIGHLEKGRTKPPNTERCREMARALSLSKDDTRKLIDAAMSERMDDDTKEWIKTQPRVSEPPPEYGYAKSPQAPSPQTLRGPLLGSCPADDIRLVYDNVEDWYEINYDLVKTSNAFCLRIAGECLVDENIYNGDIIFVSKDYEFTDGKIYVVRVDGNVSCKKVYKKNGLIILQRANKQMPEPIIVDPKKDPFEIIGRVVTSIRNH